VSHASIRPEQVLFISQGWDEGGNISREVEYGGPGQKEEFRDPQNVVDIKSPNNQRL
jgi:hypothetical protein